MIPLFCKIIQGNIKILTPHCQTLTQMVMVIQMMLKRKQKGTIVYVVEMIDCSKGSTSTMHTPYTQMQILTIMCNTHFVSNHRAIADVLTDALHELDEDCSEEESYYSSEGTDIDDLE